MINLHFHSRPTTAHRLLIEGQTLQGANVTRRQKGFSDYDVICKLVNAGWLEARPAGQRGGRRWFTTPAGAAALTT